MNKLSGLRDLFKNHKTNTGVSNKRGRTLMVLSLIGFLLIIFFTANFFLQRSDKEVRENNGIAIQSVMKSTHQAMKNIWLERYLNYARIWASDSLVIRNTKNIIGIQTSRKSLLESPSQDEIRNFFRIKLQQNDAMGIFIISKDNKNLVSMRDHNVGDENLLGIEYKGRLAKVFKGTEQLIPPIHSDVPLPDETGEMIDGYPTMFVVAPIKDYNGNIIAALSVRLNPFLDFTMIAQTGQFGNSGETYFIDAYGNLITESRFTEDLSKMGLLEHDDYSLLNIEIRDPGGDLKKGFKMEFPVKNNPLTHAAIHLIDKESGYEIDAYRDYRGVMVLGAWLWDDELGIGIISEIDEDEAMQPYHNTKTIIIGLLMVTVLLTIVFLIGFQLITQRSNRSIRENEERIRLLLESSGEGIFGTDIQGIITFVNPTVEKTLGFTSEELLGNNAHSLFHYHHVHGEDYPQTECPMYHAFAEGKTSRIDNEVLWKKDGTSIPVEYSATPMRKDNELIGSVITFSDISERKKAENELKQAQSRLITALETAKMGSWHYFVDTGIFFLDPLIRNIYGFTQDEEVSLEYIASKVHPDDIEHFTKIADQALKEGLDYTMEYRIIPRKGQVVYLSDYGKVFKNANDKVISVTGLVSDVTNQKKAEEELNQKLDELERFNRLVVGREIRMIELKKEINELQSKIGENDKYKIVQIEDFDEKSQLNNNN